MGGCGVKGLCMLALYVACCTQAAAQAVPPAAPWPDTPATREFRQRVLDLAVLYGESSGLDPNGYLIETTDQGPARPGCRSVLARTSLGGAVVSAQTLEVCKDSKDKDKAP
jgi:hypothetical protein